MQPVIDPGPVRLVDDGGAIPELGQPGLGVRDGVQDLGEGPLAVADRAQVGAVRFGDGQRDSAVVTSFKPVPRSAGGGR